MGGFSANAKTFATRYFDGDKGINIILEAKPIELGTGNTKTLYASIGYAGHTGAAKPCEPRLKLGRLRQRCYNPRWGSLRSSSSGAASGVGSPVGTGNIYNFQLFQTPDFGFGGFEIINADNGMDSWETDYNWQNADCKLRIGEIDADYSAFEDLWHFKTKGDPRWKIHGLLVFEAKLGKADFSKPLQTTALSETSRLSPRLFGTARHFKPELSTKATLVYTVDADWGVRGPGWAFTESVFDGGSDTTSHSTLSAAAGTFVLDAPPVFGVTVSTIGQNGGVARFAMHEVAADLFSELSVTGAVDVVGDLNQNAGIYVSTGHNWRVGQAISAVIGARGIWWLDADGAAASFRRVNPPEDEGSTVVDLSEADIKEMGRTATVPPIVSHSFFGRKYWDPPKATIVEDQQELERFAGGGIVANNTAAAPSDYPDAIAVWTDEVLSATPTNGSYSSNLTHVDLTALFDTPRSIYRIALTPLHALDAWIGDYISVTHPKAPGFTSATNLLVVGVEFDFQNRRVILEAFG